MEAPPDKISCKSILGFELNLGGFDCRLTAGLMMRHRSEFYGRPVYESDNGNQFLYWMRDDGTLEEGLNPNSEDAGHDSTIGGCSAGKLLESQGKWIIGSEIGKKESECLACTRDPCKFITPYEIKEVEWKVFHDGDFKPCKTIELTEQEGMAGGDSVSKFDDAPKREDPSAGSKATGSQARK